MKKYTPYIFPLVVLGIIFLLVFRWYSLKAERSEYSLLGEGVEIENLSQDEMVKSINGVGDYKTVNLEPESADSSSKGVVRYEIKDGKVRFSVMANLPEPVTSYHVWLKSPDGKASREIFTLEEGKGGYLGSAALPVELLPLEMVVSESSNPKAIETDYVLKGKLDKQTDTQVEVLEGELK